MPLITDLSAAQTPAVAQHAQSGDDMKRTSVELFVMSRCPDAHYAEQVFSYVFLNRRLQGSLLSISFHLITDADGHCMHGPAECRGNQLLLALEANSPASLLPFLEQYNKDSGKIGTHSDIEILQILQTARVPEDMWEKIIKSYQEELKSGHMLERSGVYTKSLGVRFSATVRINGEIVGIRDSGEWKELKHGIDGSVESWVDYILSFQHQSPQAVNWRKDGL